MEAYQQRVVDELKEVHDRRAALGVFIRTAPEFTKLPDVEKKLLQSQFLVMAQYETILDRRIELFKSRESRQPNTSA